ncbi:MAG: hypothetical protein ACRDSN_01710 [Pseudonocardiaceae bacterium]
MELYEQLTAALLVIPAGDRGHDQHPVDEFVPMRTAMQAAAFPGEDISDRPWPEEVVPTLRRVIDEWLPSGRYTVAELKRVPV